MCDRISTRVCVQKVLLKSYKFSHTVCQEASFSTIKICSHAMQRGSLNDGNCCSGLACTILRNWASSLNNAQSFWSGERGGGERERERERRERAQPVIDSLVMISIWPDNNRGRRRRGINQLFFFFDRPIVHKKPPAHRQTHPPTWTLCSREVFLLRIVIVF